MRSWFLAGHRVASILAACCLVVVLDLPWLASPAAVDQAAIPMAGLTTPAPAAQPRRTPTSTPVQIARKRALLRRALLQQATLRALHARQTKLEERRRLAALHQIFWLHGRGAQLYTAWGAPFTLKAINWYGFEYAPFVPGGLDHLPLDSILGMLHRMRFNALRLTFADETVERNPFVTQGLAANPQLKGLRSLDIMQRILERAHYFGLRVILCNSRSEAGLGPEHKTGLWYTKQYPASAWQADWVELVRRFRHESAFVGADLFNEPHITGNEFDQKAYFRLGPLWGAYHGQYYFDRDWHYAAQTLGDTLLSINPNLLIVVEGVQLYLDPDRNTLTGGLWGSNLTGVQYDPIALSQPSQLVYSAHEYGPQMFWAQWFNKNTTYQSLAARWDQHWGYLLTAPMSMRAPIFIGEVGTCNNYWACIDSPHPWRQGFWWQSFVRYMTAHPQVGWGYWSLNPDGPFYPGQDNFYSLVTHDWRHTHLFLRLGLAPLLKEGSG